MRANPISTPLGRTRVNPNRIWAKFCAKFWDALNFWEENCGGFCLEGLLQSFWQEKRRNYCAKIGFELIWSELAVLSVVCLECCGRAWRELAAWTRQPVPCWLALQLFWLESGLPAQSGPLQLASGPSCRCLVPCIASERARVGRLAVLTGASKHSGAAWSLGAALQAVLEPPWPCDLAPCWAGPALAVKRAQKQKTPPPGIELTQWGVFGSVGTRMRYLSRLYQLYGILQTYRGNVVVQKSPSWAHNCTGSGVGRYFGPFLLPAFGLAFWLGFCLVLGCPCLLDE
ncbi:Hypothetical_protein [Hexamita inflata]|uniref:Hypothetical_protein n=1 Tax=Hexamita inflata TaxID=28002 RepID=A0AA86PMG8_9EUKA|nr:Hypothetical protein HINF_LOCUS28549 [Hexamita inflata]CAI9940927.1 Hypothetical protein HINF_LOCUS28572 [Hexamita inflata]CAI9959964.1 Hypothetical protein HINF_LOCUS47609 [Hexamita inflata]